jgi:RNA polymerase sigma factor (sigma-70 family)
MTADLDTLAVRAQTGTSHDVDAFLRALRPLLEATARKFRLWHEEPADVVQHMVLEVLRTLPTFDRRRATAARFFGQVAHRELMTRYRAGQRGKCRILRTSLEVRLAAWGEAGEPRDHRPATPALIERRAQREAVRRAMLAADLSERQWEVLWLRFVEGLSQPQVVQRLGITKGPAWTYEQEGLRKVRPLLEMWA